MICLPLALAVLLAAPPPQSPAPAAPASPAPTGVVVARAGQVLRYDGSGERKVLLGCEVRRRYKLLVAPFDERSETSPCTFSSLATHEPTGRWAVGVSVSEPSSISRPEYFVDGKALAVPPKAGGDFFVLGDAQGVRATSSGSASAWYTGGRFRGQFLDEFSEDGRVLYFTVAQSAEDPKGPPDVRWKLSFDRPAAAAKAPPSAEAKARAKLKDVRGEVLVDGSEAFYYRKGKTLVKKVTDDVSVTECDPSAPGTWRRFDSATGKDEAIFDDGWCTTGTASFVGKRPTGEVIVLNQLGQDRVRRLYRYDRASRKTTPIPIEGLAKTPMAVSADGAFVLTWTYHDGLGLHETATGALVWKATALPASKRDDFISAAFLRDGTVPLAHPDRAFLGDGRAIPTAPGDPSLTAGQKLKSFFERTQFGTAHVVSAGVHVAELSSMDAQDVAARIRSDVQGDRPGWSVLAAWPASLEVGEVATIPVGEGFSGGACLPFSTTNLKSGRLAFVDWHEGRPQVAACATSGTLKVRKNDTGGLELELDVAFDDGSWAKGFKLWLAPVR